MAIFTAGIVLLLSIWGGKRSGLSMDPDREMIDVHKCMKTLRSSEQRWRSVGRLWDVLYELATAGELPLPQASSMSTNKRERDCDTPRSAASGESPQPLVEEDGPRVIAGSRRVTSSSSQSKRASQSQHQPNQQQHPSQVPNSSTATSHLRQPTHHDDWQHIDHSITSSATQTYALPVYSEELARLPLHGHLDFSAQAYLDHNNYWYQNVPNNGGSSGGGSESSPDSDHIVLPNSLSNHQQVPHHHHHVPFSHNVHHYTNNTTETSAISQGFSPNPTIGTGHMMFDPMPLMYMPPTPYAVVPPSIDIGPSQNPIGGGGGRPLHTGFRGISMALRGDRGVRQESSQPPAHPEQLQHQHHQYHTQSQLEHNIHSNHHHPEQQSMDYLDNDTMTMWSTAPTGFELDEWGTYLSNMSELTQGAHGAQMNVHRQG